MIWDRTWRVEGGQNHGKEEMQHAASYMERRFKLQDIDRRSPFAFGTSTKVSISRLLTGWTPSKDHSGLRFSSASSR